MTVLKVGILSIMGHLSSCTSMHLWARRKESIRVNHHRISYNLSKKSICKNMPSNLM